MVGWHMALLDYFFSFEPNQSLGWTKHFTSFKPMIIDPVIYFFFERGGMGKRIYYFTYGQNQKITLKKKHTQKKITR